MSSSATEPAPGSLVFVGLGLVVGSLMAVCGPSWIGLAGMVWVAAAVITAVVGLTGGEHDEQKGYALAGGLGLVLALSVILGWLLHPLFADDNRHLNGERVVVTVTGDCEFGKQLHRRRSPVTGSRVSKDSDGICKNVTWTDSSGEKIVGSVEVKDTDVLATASFTVNAWAIGDHASAESRIAGVNGSWWRAISYLLVLPWWALPLGLAACAGFGLLAARVPARRAREEAAAHGWTRSPDGTVTGTVDGLPFSFADAGGKRLYTLTSPVTLPTLTWADYTTDNTALVRVKPVSTLHGYNAGRLREAAEVLRALPGADGDALAELQRRSGAGADEPLPPVRGLTGPVVGIGTGLLLLAAVVQLFRAEWHVTGVLLALVAALVVWINVNRVRSVRATRTGRRRLAAARGWTYQEVAPGLIGATGVVPHAPGRSGASAVITGEAGGRRFLAGDFRNDKSSDRTIVLVALDRPVAPTAGPDWDAAGSWVRASRPASLRPYEIEKLIGTLTGVAGGNFGEPAVPNPTIG